MKVSTENDNNFGYEKITILVDNIPLKRFYDISNLISNTGGEESTDTDSDADLDEDTDYDFESHRTILYCIN
jgi:hypothetical protein